MRCLDFFQLALKVLQQSKTQTDSLSLDNSCLVNQEETANTWPLICDPQYVAQSLVTASNEVTIVKFKVKKFHSFLSVAYRVVLSNVF